MKSLNFTISGHFDKIIKGIKTVTIRGLFIPDLEPGEVVKLQEITRKSKRKIPGRSTTATVLEVRPVQFGDITTDIARAEGFNNAEESRAWLTETYNARENRWFFLIRWGKITGIQETIFSALTIEA